MKIQLTLIAILISSCLSLHAQFSDTVHINSINTGSNELLSSIIQRISLHPSGSLWLYTGGYQILEDPHFSSFLLPDTMCQNVYFDSYGNIWNGCYGKAYHYNVNDSSWTSIVYPIFPSITTQIICLDIDNIWIGTQTGLLHYESGSFTVYDTLTGLPSNIIFDLEMDNTNTLWVSTANGLCSYDGILWKTHNLEQIFSPVYENSTRFIYKDLNNKLWFGSGDGERVFSYDGNTWDCLWFDSIPDINYNTWHSLTCMTQGSDQNYYFGFTNKGILKYDGVTWQFFNEQNSNTYPRITDCLTDYNGTIWFSFAPGGISKTEGDEWYNWNTWDGLAENHIYSITQDRDSCFHFACKGAISRKNNNNNWTSFINNHAFDYSSTGRFFVSDSMDIYYPTKNNFRKFINDDWEIVGSSIFSSTFSPSDIIVINNDTVYIAYTLGILRLYGPLWNYGMNQFLYNNFPSNQINTLVEWNNQVWYGSNDGIGYLTGNTFQTVSIPGEIGPVIHYLYIDKDNNLWVCSNGGVGKYSGSVWDFYFTADGLASDNVRYMLQDKDSTFWFGTNSGLCHQTDSVWYYYSKGNGLLNNTVNTIYEDFDSNIWVGTNYSATVFYRDTIETDTLGISYYSLYNNENIIAFPNPAWSDFTLIKENDFSKKSLMIYNTNGQLLLSKGFSDDRLSMDINHLKPGRYVWVLYSENLTKLASGNFIKL